MIFGTIGNELVFLQRWKTKSGPKIMGQYPWYFRAFVLFVFAYTIHKYGFAVTPNMAAILHFFGAL